MNTLSPPTIAPATDDLRIRTMQPLPEPATLIGEVPADAPASATVVQARRAMHAILAGQDDRLAVVIGPCSIHDPVAAMEYARRLAAERERLADDLLIVMRVYFEKPRTTVGWKGLINDPYLDGSFRIERGLWLARTLLRDINALGLPAGCEFLDMVTPQYIADLVAWGAVGARTTESQVHRELASGLSCPVGFKNGTDGNVRIAVDAVQAAGQPHHFMAVDKHGRVSTAATAGNPDCHVILRGGHQPNYDAASIEATCAAIAKAGLPARVMVDASHANSGKRPENQPLVIAALAEQLHSGEGRLIGAMVESHLVPGKQELRPGCALVYGQSITDGCLGWQDSVALLDELATAVRARRKVMAAQGEGRVAVMA